MRRFCFHGTSPPDGHGPRPRLRLLHAFALALSALAFGAAPAFAQDAGSGGEGQDDGGGAGTAAEEPATDDGSQDPTAARQARISISAHRSKVPLGRRVVFTGRRQPAQEGDRVRLRYRRAGGDFRTLARTATDARGNYRVRVKPRRSGTFVVVSPRTSGKALRSGREEVSVRAKVLVEARKHQLRTRGVRVKGRVRPRGGGRRVTLERQTGKGWQRVDATRTRSNGRYRFRWKPPGLGGYALRARFRGDESNLGARTRLDHRVHVYRSDHASYYGPGFYGNTTACGQTLRRGTVGVAHKRIRCGAKVRFHYRGTTRRIPVIDRGPYIAGRRWDLTNAARKKLGFPRGTDDIWANR